MCPPKLTVTVLVDTEQRDALEQSLEALAGRARIEVDMQSAPDGIQLTIEGTQTEQRYLTRCLFRAGYDVAI